MKQHYMKYKIMALALVALTGALMFGNSSRVDAAPANAGPFTFISVQGTLNEADGTFTQTAGTYQKFIGTTPTPTPTPTDPGPNPNCPPPDPNPIVAVYSGTYALASGEQGVFSLAVRLNRSSYGGGFPEIEEDYVFELIDQGIANITLQVSGTVGSGTIQLVKNNQTIDTGTIDIDAKFDVPPVVCVPDGTPTPTPVPTPAPTPAPTPDPTPAPTDPQVQVESRTWTVQGTTYAYAKLIFPDGSYKASDWGQVSGAGNNFSVDINLEKKPGEVVPAVTTTAQIYTVGNLVPGSYTMTIKSAGQTLKTQGFTVEATPAAANPIDDARTFVRQQYMDFLGREPDGPGSDYWTNEINACAQPGHRQPGESQEKCVDRKRVNTSGAFFLSTEFQSTGYFIYRIYKGSFRRTPQLSELKQNAPQLTNGIVVNNQLALEVIESNKVAFANAWVARPEFQAAFGQMNDQQYVDQLFANTGVNPTAEEKAALVAGLGNSTETRASVLLKVIDGTRLRTDGSPEFTTNYGRGFYQKEFNAAFVLMQYFGYLGRDADEGGFNFWLDKLTRSGNFIDAEMVRSYILSAEYRSRFGQP